VNCYPGWGQLNPTHSLPIQLAGDNPSEARDNFFSQFFGVSGFYSGLEHEVISWMGGEAGLGVVLTSGGFANNIPSSCSVSWHGSTPMISEGSFSPIQCGFSPSSVVENFSWSISDPIVTVLPSPNPEEKGVFSEGFPGVVLADSTLGHAKWFSLE